MRRPALILLLMIVFAAFVSGCGKYGTRYSGEADASAGSSVKRLVTDKIFDDAEKARAGCTDVKEFESEGRTHTEDEKEKVDYGTNPPNSGDHYVVPAEWGIYGTQQPDVKTTHGLEHGYIVISYSGLSNDEIDELTDYVKRDPTHLLLQPRGANPTYGDLESEDGDDTAAKYPAADSDAAKADKDAEEQAADDAKADAKAAKAAKVTPSEEKASGADSGASSDEKPKDDAASKNDKGDAAPDSKTKKVRPGIYYTAWTAQMFCERPSAAALQFMIDKWRDQGPELFSTDPSNMGTN